MCKGCRNPRHRQRNAENRNQRNRSAGHPVPKGTSFAEALKVADEVLRQGIRGIAELIVKPSLINLDFADVKTTLKGRGLAHMGIGVAKGEKRISDAVRCAVCSPLLNTTIEGASSVILNIIGGKDLSLDEVVMAADLVRGVIDYSANVIFGACIDENMSDEVEVVIIATGFNANQNGISAESQENAFQQASVLSQKIDSATNNAFGQPAEHAFNTPVQPQPTFAPAYGQPMQPIQPIQPIQPMQPEQPVVVPFEPDDPIPEVDKVEEKKADRKHRPRFVDFFMKKNSEDK